LITHLAAGDKENLNKNRNQEKPKKKKLLKKNQKNTLE
jgi:hypothetical protein